MQHWKQARHNIKITIKKLHAVKIAGETVSNISDNSIKRLRANNNDRIEMAETRSVVPPP